MCDIHVLTFIILVIVVCMSIFLQAEPSTTTEVIKKVGFHYKLHNLISFKSILVGCVEGTTYLPCQYLDGKVCWSIFVRHIL